MLKLLGDFKDIPIKPVYVCVLEKSGEFFYIGSDTPFTYYVENNYIQIKTRSGLKKLNNSNCFMCYCSYQNPKWNPYYDNSRTYIDYKNYDYSPYDFYYLRGFDARYTKIVYTNSKIYEIKDKSADIPNLEQNVSKLCFDKSFKPTNVRLDFPVPDLHVGMTFNIYRIASVEPINALNFYKITIDNENVAKCDEFGNITIVGEGDFNIVLEEMI